MKFDPIPKVAQPVHPAGGPAPCHRLQLVPLSERLVAAFYDTPEADPATPARLAVWSGDEALTRPLLASRLLRRDGGLRQVFFIARAARGLCQRGLAIWREDQPVAEIDPEALQSPVVDPLALVVGLAPDGERRLLRALLTTGPSLFGEAAFAGLGDLVGQLIERLAPPPLALRAWVPLGSRAAIASYALPADRGFDGVDTLVALAPGGGGATPIRGAETDAETDPEAGLVHLFLPEGVAQGVAPGGAVLVGLGTQLWRFEGPAEDQRARPLGPWLDRRSPAIRRRARDRLAALAATDATARALVAEVDCPADALPEVDVQVMRATGAGVFYAVGVRDPRRLLDGLVLRGASGDLALPLGAPLYHPRLGTLRLGYAPGGEIGTGAEGVLFARYRSGRLARVGEVTPAAMGRALPAPLDALPAAAVAGPLASALADVVAARGPLRPEAEVIEIAAPARPATVTLLVELGVSLDYLYALAASLGGRQDVVLRLLHSEARVLAGLRPLGEELHAIYGIGVALVDVADAAALPAERRRAALAGIETDTAVVLSGDVLAHRSDWLAQWEAVADGPGPVLAAAEVADFGAGPIGATRRGSGAGGAGPERADVFAPRAFALNRDALALWAEMPLRVGGHGGDLEDLARSLLVAAGVTALPVPVLTLTAHAPADAPPAALAMAERYGLSGAASL